MLHSSCEWRAAGDDIFQSPCNTEQDIFAEGDACNHCLQTFGSTVPIRALSRCWHDSCLRCDACGALIKGPFIGINDRPVCKACFERTHPGRTLESMYGQDECAKCGHLIFESLVHCMGKLWHDPCLLCGLCEFPLKHYSRIGERYPLCSNCFDIINNNSNSFRNSQKNELQKTPSVSATLCCECKKEITHCHRVINVYNKLYHRRCFRCKTCNRIIQGLYHSPDNFNPHCIECYAEKFAIRCCICGFAIVDSTYQAYKDNRYHNACFNCAKCNDSLVDQQFIVVHGVLMCPEHMYQ